MNIRRSTPPSSDFRNPPDEFHGEDGKTYYGFVIVGAPAKPQILPRFDIHGKKGTQYSVLYMSTNYGTGSDFGDSSFVDGPFILGESGPYPLVVPKKPDNDPFTDPDGTPGAGKPMQYNVTEATAA